MKKLILFLLIISISFSLGIKVSNAQNDQCQTTNDLNVINKCLDDLVSARSQSQRATAGVQQQIAGIKARVASIENALAVKQKQVDDGFKELAKTEQILEATVRDYYIKSYYNNPLLLLLSKPSASNLTRILAYQRATTDQDKIIITNIALTINSLQQQSEELKIEKSNLAIVKTKLDKVVSDALAYQAQLSSQIAVLSQKQQQILAQRLAALAIPLSAATTARGCVDDRSKDPGFSPRLAFFTYGVPNRVGLNQYGAWGRAKFANESAEQILQDYYPGATLKKDYDTGATINVDGYGPYNVEEYVKRIYEMPSSWTDHDSAALKAQAVAARSYGLAHRGGICTTESCQVFKPDPKTDNGGAWINAVNATAGWVLVDGGGNPISTQYSSTHGGYVLDLGKFDGNGDAPANFADLSSRAYDGPSYANSPWFYCDWGGRGQNNTAWMRQDEVADIVNTLILVKNDSSTGEHLYQTDSPPPGTNIWDSGRVKDELRKINIVPFNVVTGITVDVDWTHGKATNVHISGDAPSSTQSSFDAIDFKNRFNLRAPANIQIVGPLYNIETQ